MDGIRLQADMSIEPGHQWIVLPMNEYGLALGKLLTGVDDMWPYMQSGLEGLYLKIAHTADVDAEIVALIDALAHVRYAAPGLVQLELEEAPEMQRFKRAEVAG